MNQLDLELKAPEGWFSQYDIAVLYPEVEAIPEHGLYLEIGTYKGRSLWIARQAAKSSVEVWGIDTLDDPKIPGTHFIQGDSLTVEWNRPKDIDVLFIDGNHGYDFVKNDIKRFAPHVKRGGAILFHDYDETSPSVVQAVTEFVESWKLNLTVFKEEGCNTSIAKVIV